MRYLLYLILIQLLLSGCARLPEYAQPHLSNEPFNSTLTYFSYRDISREDFRATVPSSAISAQQHMISAHTSLSLRPVHDIHTIINPPHLNFGVYRVYLGQLGYKAVMIPERSWWNPKIVKPRRSYVLQHEQIHFALMEIAARRINRNFAQGEVQSISHSDKNTLVNLLQKTIDRELSKSQEEILKEHTTFDEQTSLFFDPYRQQQWYDDCQQKLSDLNRWAR